MSSRNIKDCVLQLQEIYPKFKQEALDKGIDFILTCTARTLKEQTALYAQGREILDMVNAKRQIAGLPPIKASANKKVTWTMNSKHITTPNEPLAKAFDVVIVKDGAAQWSVKTNVNNNDKPDYIELAEIGKKLGLKAGADFKSPDYPHFEI